MMKLVLWLVVAMHMVLLVAVIASFICLPFRADWAVAIPLMILTYNLMATRVDCPLTNLENDIRQQLGMKRIGGFVGFYITRPFKRLIGLKKNA
jgi:hypothetical protein